MARPRFLSSFVVVAFTIYVIVAPSSAFPSTQEQSSSRLHVVSPDQLASDVLEHHQTREANLAKVGALLQRPEVRQTLALMGADWEEVEERVATLTAAELANIGGRIDEISAQHAGGMGTAATIVLIVVIAIVVIIIIWAVTVDNAVDALFGT